MSKFVETADKFFEACETGKGWDSCSKYCKEDGVFYCANLP